MDELCGSEQSGIKFKIEKLTLKWKCVALKKCLNVDGKKRCCRYK